MTGASAHGESKVHRYYAHVKRRGEAIDCQIKRISADDLEATIVKHLGRILHRAGYFEGIEKNIKNNYSVNGEQRNGEIERAQKALDELDLEIRGAFKIQSRVDSMSDSFAMVAEQMDQLAKKKRDLSLKMDRLQELSVDENGLLDSVDYIRDRLNEVQRGWAKMTVAQKKRLLRRLIARLEVHPDKVGIVFFMANGMEALGPLDVGFTANGISPNGGSKNKVIPFKNKKPTETNLSVQNLRVVNNGETYTNILETSVLSVSQGYVIAWSKDKINLTDLARKRWVDKWSMDKLATELGWGRTAVIRGIGLIKANPDLVDDGQVRLRILRRKRKFLGS